MRRATLIALTSFAALTSNLNGQDFEIDVNFPQSRTDVQNHQVAGLDDEATPEASTEADDSSANASSVQEKAKENPPIFVSLNAEGELIGQAMADVDGKEMPVEANLTIVKDGVVISSVVADEDGSFAFPSVAPGTYNMFGSAATFAGQQQFHVLPSGGGSCDCANIGLSPYSGGSYSVFSGAPTGSFGGGGFYGGGGGAFAGGSKLRLLAIGGIAAGIAIAVSDDDGDASPTN